MQDLFKDLNPAQRAAVEYGTGPLLILAGAGSGKTKTATARVARLILSGVPPASICVLTFTNKAAQEIRHRIGTVCGEQAAQITAGTFHSIAARLLRTRAGAIGLRKDFTIYDEQDALSAFKSLIPRVPDDRDDIKNAYAIVSAARDRGVMPIVYAEDKRLEDTVECALACRYYDAYVSKLQASNAVDFAGLLLLLSVLCKQDPDHYAARWEHIVVDEYQDTNAVQDELVTAFARQHRNICAVGDEQQCQPDGTMVAIKDGEIAIEKLKIGDHVIRYNSPGGYFRGLRGLGGKVVNTHRRLYKGAMYEFSVADKTVQSTPNHKWIVKLNTLDQEKYIVYLMMKGKFARIGMTSWRCGMKGTVLGITSRMHTEKADRGWILSVYDDKASALIAEKLISLKYGITETVFKKGNSHNNSTQQIITAIHAALGDMTERVDACLKAHNKDINYPFTVRGEYMLKGETTIIRSCNIFSDLMSMRTYTGQSIGGEWFPVKVRIYSTECYVNSLEIEPTIDGRQLYVSNGIVTHNSIYAFRGAKIQNILSFPQRWEGTKIVRLESNYRSRPEILAPANAILRGAEGGYGKTLIADRLAGGQVIAWIAEDEYDEARRIVSKCKQLADSGRFPYSTQAIIYRMNMQSRVIEQEMNRAGVPYRIVGGLSFWDRAEIKDACAYLRLIHNRADDVAFLRICNVPRRGLGDAAIKRIEQARDAGSNAPESDPDPGAMLSQLFATTPGPAINAPDETGGMSEMPPAPPDDLYSMIPIGTPQMSLFDASERAGLKGVARQGLDRLKAALSAAETAGPVLADILRNVLDAIGYAAYLEQDKETAEDRQQNLDQLYDLCAGYEDLSAFLEYAALSSEAAQETGGERVTLCTMHGSKGLEWPVVYAPGWESSIFPSPRACAEGHAAEERRLAYVCITRARDVLYVSGARYRRGTETRPSSLLRAAGLLIKDWCE